MTASFRLNRKGGEEVLKQLAAPLINSLAQQVTDAAGEDAEMVTYTTDRAAASVRVPADQQAKDGALTRAVSSAGLEVRSK
ncbi:hypothetical protein AB0K45_09575 [Micrococcus luteus]|uniref:hypothetical protein n=1 Tax=Micrococcus luteus TaxID=1270 RepID=UPI00342DDC0E